MIFVDTGPLLARHSVRDQYRAAAREGWSRLRAEAPRLVTSLPVVVEFAALLGRHAGNSFAAERPRSLYRSSTIEILRSDQEAEMEAVEFFEKYADQHVGFLDCISFALMRRHRVQRVFTFDRHFDQAGFDIFRFA